MRPRHADTEGKAGPHPPSSPPSKQVSVMKQTSLEGGGVGALVLGMLYLP